MAFQLNCELSTESSLGDLRSLEWDLAPDEAPDEFSNLHWYPARFRPQLARFLIERFSEKGGLVLDPFCGSGTTLVEARKLGRYILGIDNSPVAAMITRSKVTPIPLSHFDGARKDIISSFDHNLVSLVSPSLTPSVLRPIAHWHNPRTMAQLVAIWSSIMRIGDNTVATIFKVAFSAILRAACGKELGATWTSGNDSEPWAWLLETNLPESPPYVDAFELFRQKLTDFRSALSVLQSVKDEKYVAPTWVRKLGMVLTGQCAEVLKGVPNESVDLVVTSPPYWSFYDYATIQKLSFEWFGDNLILVQGRESGARTSGPDNTVSLDKYLDDMRLSFYEVQRVLCKKGICCVVVGETHSSVPHLNRFENELKKVGLEIIGRLVRNFAQTPSAGPSLREERILACCRGS